MKSKKNNAYTLSEYQNIDLLARKHNCKFQIYQTYKDHFNVELFYGHKIKNFYELGFGRIIVDLTLIVDTVGFFSPRKLKTCFGIQSKKPLIVFQFMSKYNGSGLRTHREFEIHNNFEYFFVSEKDFDQFNRICGLEVLEPPKIILNMESHEKEE